MHEFFHQKVQKFDNLRRVLDPHPVLIHMHMYHNVFQLLVGPLLKPPYTLYEVYLKNNITFINNAISASRLAAINSKDGIL
uniref:Uncharacterized protein n=1 Tax=Romanomermis culicivorax TaxID=13658 RepID=A0A915KDP5_ROMCU